MVVLTDASMVDLKAGTSDGSVDFSTAVKKAESMVVLKVASTVVLMVDLKVE